jgi:hypothetical protein
VFKREVCAGFDAKAVTRALIEAGWIEPGDGRHYAQRVRVPGLGLPRCYVFTGRMWSESELH